MENHRKYTLKIECMRRRFLLITFNRPWWATSGDRIFTSSIFATIWSGTASPRTSKSRACTPISVFCLTFVMIRSATADEYWDWEEDSKRKLPLMSSECQSLASFLARRVFPTPGRPRRRKHVGLDSRYFLSAWKKTRRDLSVATAQISRSLLLHHRNPVESYLLLDSSVHSRRSLWHWPKHRRRSLKSERSRDSYLGRMLRWIAVLKGRFLAIRVVQQRCARIADCRLGLVAHWDRYKALRWNEMNSTRIPPTILSVHRLATTLYCHLDVAGVASLSENYFKRKTIFLDISNWFSFFLAWIHARSFIFIDR